MNILITAGGTKEKIDQVRSIVNHSTGRLGKAIADTFSVNEQTHIDYVTTQAAVKPEQLDHVTIHLVETTQDLLTTLDTLLHSKTYDVIIHSMAVSDFTPAFSLSEEQFAASLQNQEQPIPDWFAENEAVAATEQKIPSTTDHLVIVLKKTPKIIQYLRHWQPSAVIVGFKLLVDVPKEQLLAVAQKSLEMNQTDFIFANDLTQITEDQHHGYLVSADGQIDEANTKKEIAALIVEKVQTERKKI